MLITPTKKENSKLDVIESHTVIPILITNIKTYSLRLFRIDFIFLPYLLPTTLYPRMPQITSHYRMIPLKKLLTLSGEEPLFTVLMWLYISSRIWYFNTVLISSTRLETSYFEKIFLT